MSVYVRGSGDHAGERVQPEPGSDEEARLQALVDDPASGWRREPEPEPDDPISRPAKSASKADWVAWAVAEGAERAEAEKATKDDLIARYGQDGSAPDGQGEGGPDGGGES